MSSTLRVLPAFLFVAFVLLPPRAQADPIILVGGFLVSEGGGSNAAFNISGEGLAASGLTGIGNVGPAQCSGCVAGEPIALTTLFVGDRFERPHVVLDGMVLENVGLLGTLAFDAQSIVAPSEEAPFTVRQPFTFTGSLAGFPDPFGEPREFLFERTLIGRGTLTASFELAPRHPDDPVLFQFRSVRYDFEPIPEPATLLLLGSGLAGIVVRHRRSRRRDAQKL